MSTIVNFKGQNVIEPGVYAQTKSGITPKPVDFSFGNLAIIDTGSSKEWGGGSGINGKFSNGGNSIYTFQDSSELKKFVKGGLLFDLSDSIFSPMQGATGPNRVHLIRACSTEPSKIEIDFSSDANGGKLVILTKNEGEVSNGVTNEKLGKASLRLSLETVKKDNTIILEVGTEKVGEYKLLSNSLTEALYGIRDSINSGNTGYSSEIDGKTIVLLSKANVDPSVENLDIKSSGTVTLTSESDTKFFGYEAGNKLIKGYCAFISKSDDDPTKINVSFLEGTFSGYTENKMPIGGYSMEESNPTLVAKSPDFDNIDDLIQYAKNDFTFKKLFYLEDSFQKGTGEINTSKVSNLMILAKDGKSTYNAKDLDDVLENISELDNTFFLSDRYGKDSISVQNQKILEHINRDAEFEKFLIIGGGSDETQFDSGKESSIEVAKFYNTERVILVHDGIIRYNISTREDEKLPSIYHASYVAGRLGGLEPQTPITFKPLDIKGFNHPLKKKQREKALQKGVLHNRAVEGIGNVTNQGINTLQKNTTLINPDGTSHEISIMRISGQLNKELTLNARPLFVGNNWGSASPADVKTFIESYLFGKTPQNGRDGLILSFKNVTVKQKEDYYEISYGFVPNGPLNKLFITGFILDANLTA